ncbi:MAG: tryptophan 7-halogenase [Labilithrix sp.]|nr:tryptophan 7-halogenase [Labilithrix sp.]
MSSAADVVVIGGGPGGSVCAAELARKGRSTIVLERAAFPRFHLGESLLPQSLPVLEEIGVLDAVKARFIEKHGACFHDDRRGKKERFAFDAAWKPAVAHAFQVPRDAFDALLLGHARACGAEVRERWTATRVVTDERGRAVGVDAIAADGASTRIDARFVVDASGRAALTAHAAGATTKIAGLDQTALYAHYEGVPRQDGDLAGDIDIVLFGSGLPASGEGGTASRDAASGWAGRGERPNWFWFIPFEDGRTSVGAVVSRAWMRDRRARLGAAADVTTSLFDVAVSESSTAAQLLAGATRLWPRVEATADFSYRVGATHGDGWLAVGDAGGFIDPLFSTGAHLAITGGKLAADAVARALDAPDDERRVVGAWDARVRSAAETFILAVQAFYAGPLVDYLFAEDKHTALRRSITSLLAGDVYSEAVWLRDTRLRLQEMLASVDAGAG